MSNLIVLPYLSITPNYLVAYSRVMTENGDPYRRTNPSILPIDNKHHGIVSKKAGTKIQNSVDYILHLAKTKYVYPNTRTKRFHFKVAFITLTLSSEQIHTDDEIKKALLNQFLVEARQKWKVKNYIWRAEPQENGNIHFHILIDQYVPWSELRDTWNRIQNKLGYVTRYRNEMKTWHDGGFKVRYDLQKKWSYKKQIKAYKEGSKNDWNSPNSTDIHQVRKIKSLSKYMGKYMTKNKASREIEGRLWGTNIEISKLRGAILLRDNQVDDEILSLIDKFPGKVFTHDYFTVIFCNPDELMQAGSKILFNAWLDWLVKLRE